MLRTNHMLLFTIRELAEQRYPKLHIALVFAYACLIVCNVAIGYDVPSIATSLCGEGNQGDYDFLFVRA